VKTRFCALTFTGLPPAFIKQEAKDNTTPRAWKPDDKYSVDFILTE